MCSDLPAALRNIFSILRIFFPSVQGFHGHVTAEGLHFVLQVCTFHDGCKQAIDQQIFNRKSISRKITSECLHFKNCWKSGPKVPTLRDQWPMARRPLDHVGLSGNFMTIITEDKQIFVYIQWEMKLLLICHKKRNTIICISAVNTWNAVEIQDFFITLILLSKEHVYCCTFRVILTLHEFLHFYYIIRQSYPTGSQTRCNLQCSGVPRANSFFNIALKMLQYFQNVIK